MDSASSGITHTKFSRYISAGAVKSKNHELEIFKVAETLKFTKGQLIAYEYDDPFLFELPKMAACNEVFSLRNAEEDVVGCLEAADLRRFLDDSCALGAIPQGVKKDFASLDPEAVPRSLMVRYLLLHVYEWLEANPRLYERWLKVLGRYVSEEVLCKVRQGYAMLVSPKVSAETMCLADGGIEEGFKCGIQGGVNFRERHVSILTEILVGWSAKWYQIGLSLNLPHNYLDQLATLLVIHGCEVCLSKVLHEWIVG